MKKGVEILLLGVLLVGLVVGGVAVQISTENRQHASQFNDLNSAKDITSTNNQDGTMGPASYVDNFSNTLPVAYLGSLNFQVTDPDQGKRQDNGNDHNQPTPSITPTQTPPAPSQSSSNSAPSASPGQGTSNGGPQTVTSLMVTITKVEVHLARLGIPGQKNQIEPTVAPGKPTVTPGPKDNQNVDKWETLNIGNAKTVDLVQLAKTKVLVSLGLTSLANGKYTEVRLYVSSATATLGDGTHVTLTLPGRANIVRVVEPFVIDSGKTTTLSIDFDAQNSVIKTGNVYILKPVVARFDQKNQQ